MVQTQAKIYMIISNDRGEKCLFLTPTTPYNKPAEHPEFLYDGKENAILYRTKDEAIIIDYIPEDKQKELLNIKTILVVEYDQLKDNITHEYMANITITKQIPDLGPNFKKVNT